MTPESLLREFDVMADAPNGIPKLRELVLQLAVRGKLVAQDQNDESASVLLELITAERNRLFGEGESGKPKPLAAVSGNDVPFRVPPGWEWVRIGQAMKLVNGRAFKPTDWCSAGVPIVRIQNLNDPNAPFNYCDVDVADKFYINDEDLLLSWSGTPGTSFGAFVWRRGRAVLNQHIFRCELLGSVFVNDFARLAINGRLNEMIAQAHGGVGLQHVTKGKLDNLPIVLPPIAEQQRIVAKVDELMALCDQLETRQLRRGETRARVNHSVLHYLTSAGDDKEFDRSWQRLRKSFHVLYDAPEEVAELRQAVLQLAVRGKLVPQDPSDEPASILLGRIAVAKAQLAQEGKISTPKALPVIRGEEVPFEVPLSWKWVHWAEIANNVQYGYTASADATIKAVRLVRITDIQNGHVAWESVPGCIISDSDVPKYELHEGDLLIARTGGTIGKSYIVPRPTVVSVFASYLIRVIPAAATNPRFVFTFARSPLYWKQLLARSAGTGQPNVNGSSLSELLFPLPPLAEQGRIVAEVNALMALCDRLQARLTRARENSDHLAASVVHHLTAASHG